MSPLAQVVAGPAADQVLEPLFQAPGPEMKWLTDLFGTGAGAGMAFQIALAGIFTALVGVSGYLFPTVRQAEELLPDHDTGSSQTEAQSPVAA